MRYIPSPGQLFIVKNVYGVFTALPKGMVEPLYEPHPPDNVEVYGLTDKGRIKVFFRHDVRPNEYQHITV